MAKKPSDILSKQKKLEEDESQILFEQGSRTLRDLISPSSIEIHSSYFRLGVKYCRTMYISGYPREIYTGWLGPIITMDEVLDISMYIYPVETEIILKNLTKKVAQLEATATIQSERGQARDPEVEAQIRDTEELRDVLQVGAQRFFRLGLYVTIYADSLEELSYVQHKIETVFGQQMIYSKIASCQQEQGLNSTAPQCSDQLQIRRNMDTGATSSSFPFTNADLTQSNGILYGVNLHNNGLVIFDRFSLENANMVVFAKAGAGKSFAVKLECMRSMMIGTDIIIIDPENEYEKLANAVGGSYVRLSLNSNTRINPFDLPKFGNSQNGQVDEDPLRSNLISLHGLMKLILGGSQLNANGNPINPLTPSEEADLDQALIDTYARVGITSDPLTHRTQPPTIIDLYDTLLHMGGSGPSLAQRLRRYTTGTFAGIFSQQSNVDINNPMVVFSVRDLEEDLRPVAMYIVLNHIWGIIRFEQKRRLLVVDEAWQLMRYDDSAQFLFSIAKRARKYYLGLTTVTQDVEDFMSTKLGRAIVSNSSISLLLKQSTSSVDILAEVFKLTDEERRRLAAFPVGQGLFFAGQNHVAIQIEASDTEKKIASTTPKDKPIDQNAIPASSDEIYLNNQPEAGVS